MFRNVFTAFLFLITAEANAKVMNLEGSCKGVDAAGAPISFNYYSSFDGCENNSDAAISFTDGTMQEVLLTGTRLIQNREDKYSFTAKYNGTLQTILWLSFEDPSEDGKGVYKYRNLYGEITSVALQCRIRQYEYAECGL